jgi:CelD/BcsL family acetyltransferase involved in cellulose biosynthesis
VEDVALAVEVIRDPAAIPIDAETWNRLVAEMDDGTVFQTREWFDAWWSSYGADQALYLVIAHRGSRIVGFAPFVTGPGGHSLRIVGQETADYVHLYAEDGDPAVIQRMLDALVEAAAHWSSIQVRNLPSTSASLKALEGWADHRGRWALRSRPQTCPTLRVAGEHEPAARALLRKYSLKRPLNHFSRRGRFVTRVIEEPEEIARLLPVFFAQHRDRWALRGQRSAFSSHATRRFFAALGEGLLPRGWLLFSVSELDGRPIAFHFGFDYRGRVIWYKPSFDTAYAKHSPGLLSIRHLIEHALAQGRQEVDFTIGNEDFKWRYANDARVNFNLFIYRRRIPYLRHKLLQRLRGLAALCLRRLAALRKHLHVGRNR